jgi:hypothetical protein
MNESIKKYENHSILRQIELMSYVSSDPNYTEADHYYHIFSGSHILVIFQKEPT